MAEADKDKAKANDAKAAEAPANETPLDPLDETPPKAEKGVEKNPAADANPEAADLHNMMNTQGLSPAERARVEGTVLDGANGAHVRGVAANLEEPAAHKAGREAADKARKDRAAAAQKSAAQK